ncbi:MAG: helix-turn-helix transcriptional regulator [Phycisphaerae bacterium]|nr:helix-turn-helix transcriptional regulator [Phycisphaerae bacterium]
MRRTRSSVHFIESPRQQSALAAPLRQEIIDAASAHGGPMSVAELAGQLGRPADRLYFHVRALVRVGLLVTDGERKEGRHVATLYRLPADEVRLKYRPRDKRNVQRVTAVVDGVLRLARRDFRRRMLSGDAMVEGPKRDTRGGRLKGWLDEEQSERLVRLLGEIHELMRENGPREGARAVAFTFVCVPVDVPGPKGKKKRK